MGILQSFVDGWNGIDVDKDPTLFTSASYAGAANDPTPIKPGKNGEDLVRESKAMRENQSEQQLDKMLKDSFPASDPPSSY